MLKKNSKDLSFKLYHYYRSSCSWRLRWALQLKNLSYSSLHVNLLAGEQSEISYTKINSSQSVPSLAINGTNFSESLALIEWLEESYPKPSLLPKGALERLYVRELALVIASGTQPLQNLQAQKYYSESKEKRLQYTQYWISRGLNVYEEKLRRANLSALCSYKDQVSLADLCLIPQCYNAVRFKLDLKKFPIINKIYQHCLELSSCQESAPDKFV